MQEILTIKQVAEKLQLTKITVYRLIKTGELPACRVGLKKVRIPVTWLEDYFERKRIVKEPVAKTDSFPNVSLDENKPIKSPDYDEYDEYDGLDDDEEEYDGLADYFESEEEE